MAMPSDVGVIDLLIGFPSHDARHHYDYLRKLTKDTESQAADFPAEYMFKQVPNYLPEGADPIATALQEMDVCGVAIGMLSNPESSLCQQALRDHPRRFVSSLEIDPNDITGAVRKIRECKELYDIKAVTSFPAGCNPRWRSTTAGTTPCTRPASISTSRSCSTQGSSARAFRRRCSTSCCSTRSVTTSPSCGS